MAFVCVSTLVNKYVRRPTYPVHFPKDAVTNIDSSVHFISYLDTSGGYFQVPLKKSCQHLTTFATPWGKYFFRAVPQ